MLKNHDGMLLIRPVNHRIGLDWTTNTVHAVATGVLTVAIKADQARPTTGGGTTYRSGCAIAK